VSSESLAADISACLASAKSLSALSSMSDVVDHLKSTLWPMLEAIVNEHVELDAVVGDLYEHSEDILQMETAKVFAAVIASGLVLAEELRTRVGNDKRLLAAIGEFKAKANEAREILEEITIPDDPEDDTEEDDEDGDDDEGTPDDDDGTKPE
jgi:hypothetical protein